jgi:cytosine/adenosine deaminase-related metal-dependent hydrolase
MRTTYTARMLFTAAGPPVPGGTVTVEGDRILAVNDGIPPDVDLGDVAILPGLVNAHTHLDLSGAKSRIPPTTADAFTDWLAGVIAYRKTRTPSDVEQDIHNGLQHLMEASTTTVGDISVRGTSWDALAESSIRARVYWELIGLDEYKLEQAWVDSGVAEGTYWFEDAYTPGAKIRPNTRDCHWGISPHAPYTVHGPSARTIFTVGIPSATHIAETPAERELLEHRSGPFVPFLQKAGVYREDAFAPNHADFLKHIRPNAQNRRRLIVHGNDLPPDFAFHSGDVLCYCPRTHAAFGHAPHPFRAFLRRGVPVCLGTDSLASNPDLDLVAEACAFRTMHPDVDGETVLNMVTRHGAVGLGFEHCCGTLEPGKSADFSILPWSYGEVNPYEHLFRDVPKYESRKTLFRGQWRK